MSQYFPPYRSPGGIIKVKLYLSSYTTKTNSKSVTTVDVSSFATKTNLANLNTEVYKIDADKLKTAPLDLARLSNVFKNNVVKKTEYDKLVAKVKSINTTGLVLKTTYDTGKSDLENNIVMQTKNF